MIQWRTAGNFALARTRSSSIVVTCRSCGCSIVFDARVPWPPSIHLQECIWRNTTTSHAHESGWARKTGPSNRAMRGTGKKATLRSPYHIMGGLTSTRILRSSGVRRPESTPLPCSRRRHPHGRRFAVSSHPPNARCESNRVRPLSASAGLLACGTIANSTGSSSRPWLKTRLATTYQRAVPRAASAPVPRHRRRVHRPE